MRDEHQPDDDTEEQDAVRHEAGVPHRRRGSSRQSRVAILTPWFGPSSSTSTSRSPAPAPSSARTATGAPASGTGSSSTRSATRLRGSTALASTPAASRARARRRALGRLHRADRPRDGRRRRGGAAMRARPRACVGAARPLHALRGRVAGARRPAGALDQDRPDLERQPRSRRVRRATTRSTWTVRSARGRSDARSRIRRSSGARWSCSASSRGRRRWSATPTRTTSRVPARSECRRSCSTATGPPRRTAAAAGPVRPPGGSRPGPV